MISDVLLICATVVIIATYLHFLAGKWLSLKEPAKTSATKADVSALAKRVSDLEVDATAMKNRLGVQEAARAFGRR